MTRDEFIDGYMARSGIGPERRTPTGFRLDGRPDRIAMPCECAAEQCGGWSMVSNDPDSIETHLDLYDPRT